MTNLNVYQEESGGKETSSVQTLATPGAGTALLTSMIKMRALFVFWLLSIVGDEPGMPTDN